MPMVVESTFELARITACQSSLFFTIEFPLQKRRHRAILLLYLCVSAMFYKKFFRSNNIRRLKSGFLW